jgi:hypothetical protein
MATDNLNITTPTEAGSGKIAALNTAITTLDKAQGTVLTKTLAGANVTLTETETKETAVLILDGTLTANVQVRLNDDIDKPMVVVVETDLDGNELTLRQVTAGAGNGEQEEIRLERWDVICIQKTDTADLAIIECGTGNEFIKGFVNGTPATSDIIWGFVANRRMRIVAGGDGHYGYWNTAPSGGSADIDIQKNGGSVGTMGFADGVNAATWTIGSDIDLDPGDRLTFHSPGALNSAADLFFNMKALRR